MQTVCQLPDSGRGRARGAPTPSSDVPKTLELDLVEAAIERAAGSQLVVGAHVDDPAVPHHHDPIGQRDRPQTVGDDQGRSAANELLEDLLDELLAFQVDLAGGLVEDENGRVAEDGAGQGDPLALASGELTSHRAQQRIVALGKLLLDEPVGMRLLGRPDHLLARGVRRAVADVVQRGVVEQDRVLGDDADLTAQVAKPDVVEPDAVQTDGPRIRIGEPGNQADEAGLAATAGPNDGDRLAEVDSEADVAQHRPAGHVGEVDSVEYQVLVVAG